MSKKKIKGVVYSTNPDYNYDYDDHPEEETLPPNDQMLKISLDKKQRKGKQVTLVEGFVGSSEGLKELGKSLKSLCGVGGSEKNGQIIIQGDFREKINNFLMEKQYKTKLMR